MIILVFFGHYRVILNLWVFHIKVLQLLNYYLGLEASERLIPVRVYSIAQCHCVQALQWAQGEDICMYVCMGLFE